MGLYKFRPPFSGRMGTLWTLAPIRGAVLLEYGCMGHMNYARVFLSRAGVPDACKLYSTHIDETDIALGGTERLERAVAAVAQRDKPPVLFLLPLCPRLPAWICRHSAGSCSRIIPICACCPLSAADLTSPNPRGYRLRYCCW